MAKTVTLRLEEEVYKVFAQAAKAENRPLIETAALSRIREQQFVDDAEMSEIMANENLLKRLKKGARDAAMGKGRFVD
jgi:hypothetical protein